MKHLVQPMVFLSAYRADMPIEMNVQRHAQLCRDLESIHRRYLSVVGSYAGKMEQSVAIAVHNSSRAAWLDTARRYGQESILVRHADGSCYLVYCDDGREVYIGQWREVSAARAQDSGAWSRIGGKYYQAV
jgi:hypothetical protein